MLPYFAPVELVVAAGMVPMGIWGSNKKTIAQAKEYCACLLYTSLPGQAGCLPLLSSHRRERPDGLLPRGSAPLRG